MHVQILSRFVCMRSGLINFTLHLQFCNFQHRMLFFGKSCHFIWRLFLMFLLWFRFQMKRMVRLISDQGVWGIRFVLLFSKIHFLQYADNAKARLECIRIYEPRLFQNFSRNATISTFKICGMIMMVTSLIVTGFFMLQKAPIVIQKTWLNIK